MSRTDGRPAQPTEDLAELRDQLREARETLDAIRNGEVDAVVVGGPNGQQIYTLENADRPYRVLIEQMQEGALTLSFDGLILYCNERFAILLDVSRESLIGQDIGSFIDTPDRPVFGELVGRIDGIGRKTEIAMVSGTGQPVPVNVSMVDLKVEEHLPRVICCVVTDLTQNRQRNLELTRANARLANEINERQRVEESLQIALDAAGMGSWDIDLSSSAVRTSRRFSQIFGMLDASMLLDTGSFMAAFVAEDKQAVNDAFDRALSSGSMDLEKRICRATDGATRLVHVRGQTYYEHGVAVRIAGVVSDVTERRLVDQQLRQAQKMEAIGQLTGGIAHDFNNLLMVIGGSLDLIERRMPKDDRTSRHLLGARQGVERGAILNQQLLAFSRRQDLRAEPVCVEELLASFGNLLDRAVGEVVSIRVIPARARWLCKTDPHQLETAILNLAINARDAMPNGGSIAISTELHTLGEAAASALGGKAGEYVVTSIADQGIGMSAELASRVFEPFFTTKEIGKGTGLGLSQVYGFARQSGGFVSIDSEPGRGTTVSIYLPSTEDREAVAARDTTTAYTRGCGTVLVVEDDRDVREIACSVLGELGSSVLEAASGSAAIQMLREGPQVDLVFSDVIMAGGMSGIDLARHIYQHYPDIPVLMTSGYTAQQFSNDDFSRQLEILRKPYSMAELSKVIRARLDRKMAQPSLRSVVSSR